TRSRHLALWRRVALSFAPRRGTRGHGGARGHACAPRKGNSRSSTRRVDGAGAGRPEASPGERHRCACVHRARSRCDCSSYSVYQDHRERRENAIIEAKGRRAEEHQEGGEGREAKEDDLEAAEEDTYRTRQRGREG